MSANVIIKKDYTLAIIPFSESQPILRRSGKKIFLMHSGKSKLRWDDEIIITTANP